MINTCRPTRDVQSPTSKVEPDSLIGLHVVTTLRGWGSNPAGRKAASLAKINKSWEAKKYKSATGIQKYSLTYTLLYHFIIWNASVLCGVITNLHSHIQQLLWNTITPEVVMNSTGDTCSDTNSHFSRFPFY